jgi:hypothetical protein
VGIVERLVRDAELHLHDLRVYGAFWDMVIEREGKAMMKRSAERYLRQLEK